MLRDAVFSASGDKRYLLTRDWTATGQPRVMSLTMLNPSIAGATRDDTTVTKAIGFATRWGYTKLLVTNLEPTVATDPWRLPYWSGIDPENRRHLLAAIRAASIIVVAWGSLPKPLRQRISLAERVYCFTELVRGENRLNQVRCIGVTQSGYPLHPSRAPYADGPLAYDLVDDCRSAGIPMAETQTASRENTRDLNAPNRSAQS